MGETKRPQCSRSECFACVDGLCIVLNDNDFPDRGGCPFFKTENDYRKDLADHPFFNDQDATGSARNNFYKYESSRRKAKSGKEG